MSGVFFFFHSQGTNLQNITEQMRMLVPLDVITKSMVKTLQPSAK